MGGDVKRVERDLTVQNTLGLHVRPIAQLVKTASKFRCTVKVRKDGDDIDGKSVMDLLFLAAGKGEVLHFTIAGDDAAAAMAAIEALFAAKFNED